MVGILEIIWLRERQNKSAGQQKHNRAETGQISDLAAGRSSA